MEQFRDRLKIPQYHIHSYTSLCTWVSFGGNHRANVLLLSELSDKGLIILASSIHSCVFLERTVAPHHDCLIRLIGSQHQANLIEKHVWLSVLISNCFCLALNEPLLTSLTSCFSGQN